MAASIRIERYALPDTWASALMNGSTSGMDTEDERLLEAWLAKVSDGRRVFCCIDCSAASHFTWHQEQFGDLSIPAGNRLEFTFAVN